MRAAVGGAFTIWFSEVVAIVGAGFLPDELTSRL